MRQKYYVFFIAESLPQPMAHLVQVVQCANAAANLGYPTLLVYVKQGKAAQNPIDWVYPFRPQPPSAEIASYYHIDNNNLKVLSLALPWPIGRIQPQRAWSTPSSWLCKYYLPLHLMQHTQLVHTRNWNFAQAAIRLGIPTIYEQHHLEEKHYPSEVVQHPLLQTAVTVVESVRQDMVKNGMPSNKVVTLHNGYNRLFMQRQPHKAEAWRSRLLGTNYERLVVYSGALYTFKGVDLLLEIAKGFPHVKFAFAGGPDEQRQQYERMVADRHLENVSFLGFITQDQLASLLQAADVLAHPHLDGKAASFTSPLKFFDYMASGTPIIASEISSMIEFKNAGVVAAWCPPNSPHAFASCLTQVLAEYPHKFDGYIDSVDYIRQFSWENRITKILNRVDGALRPQII
ncbi:MAG: glycosyltransferase [Cyanobacteria bacterium P01_F01_bin.150]